MQIKTTLIFNLIPVTEIFLYKRQITNGLTKLWIKKTLYYREAGEVVQAGNGAPHDLALLSGTTTKTASYHKDTCKCVPTAVLVINTRR